MTAALGTDAKAVLAVVDQTIEQLLGHPIRVIRFRGVPGSPLTLSRIVQELGAGKRGGLPADDDEMIVRMLAKPSKGEGSVLLVIEQAEILPGRTLAFLQVISTVFGARTPRLQLLFAGHPRFERLIEKDELTGIRDRLETVVQVASAAVDMAPHRMGNGKKRGQTSAASKVARRRTILVLSSALIIAVGASFATVYQSRIKSGGRVDNSATSSDGVQSYPLQPYPFATAISPQPSAPLPVPQTAPPPTSPRAVTPEQPGIRDPDPATAIQPAKRRAWPTGEQLTRLRDEFDRFLAQTERGSKRQSETERSRLFEEFLQWNYGSASADPELSATAAMLPLLSRARVTLHFLQGSTSGEGMARRFAKMLRPSVSLARTRVAADVPKTFELRYFAQEDEGVAGTLAQMAKAPEVTWTLRLMPDARPAPAPHTIEFWIPLR